jgi:excinuclease ABC subunit B
MIERNSSTKFKVKSDWEPAGDQPKAITDLVDGFKSGKRKQTLLGVTGSGKTFTVAKVIEKLQSTTLVIAHNKTLAAQLANEFKEFFPENKVHYFVSYYDYYQPEAYVSATDTYIEKDASINEEINRLRHASTQSILTRQDTIIVASVSCIYGLGSPEDYKKENLLLAVGDEYTKQSLMEALVKVHFERTNADLASGTFRSVGNRVDIQPMSETWMASVFFSNGQISMIQILDPVSMRILEETDSAMFFPAKHFITDQKTMDKAIVLIQEELNKQVKKFESEGKLLEADRIKRRTMQDMAMMREVGYCSGIENYSRLLSGKKEGEAPETLISYFPHDAKGNPEFLTVIDESHVTLPQLHGMYAGDQSRKTNLVNFGFRLPSALDNRPLRYEEFDKRVGQVLYVSATPGKMEIEESESVVEQIIRPTGLIDPQLTVKPVLPTNGKSGVGVSAKKSGVVVKGETIDIREKFPNYPGQIEDFIIETQEAVKAGGRVIATTLTKKMAEDLSNFLKDRKIKAEYLHSDIKTIERIQILTKFRRGDFDCLVGVNLLREGLDLPEVSLIGILDADKEGFLRSETSLIQTIGRAARNVLGRVILYADVMTGSMERAIGETNRRRKIQEEFNTANGITPQTILKKIHDITEGIETIQKKTAHGEAMLEMKLSGKKVSSLLKQKEKEMKVAAKELDFEVAAILRDEIKELQKMIEDQKDKSDKASNSTEA